MKNEKSEGCEHDACNPNCKCKTCCQEKLPMNLGKQSKMAKSNGSIATAGGSSEPA